MAQRTIKVRVASCQNYIEAWRAPGHDALQRQACSTHFTGAAPLALLMMSGSPLEIAKFKRRSRQLVNKATGKPFAFTDACVEHGASVQYNDQAATAQSSVRSFLTEVFEQKVTFWLLLSSIRLGNTVHSAVVSVLVSR